MRYVIEHLEPRLFKWCLLEYRHIVSIVGKENALFTNLASKELPSTKDRVKDLDLKHVCVLDPYARKTLSASDKFENLIFGGILGDAPMQGRTTRELTMPLAAESRNLGKYQFSTDTAVYVAKHLMGGGKLSELSFQDTITIEISDSESVELPFRYVMIGGIPLLPPCLVEYLKSRKGF
jgi:ribosome biogenesis SPOUT family RNA methylase Rps3